MRVSADSTVWVAMTSSAATSRLVSPRATRLAMRRSAGLRIWSVGLALPPMAGQATARHRSRSARCDGFPDSRRIHRTGVGGGPDGSGLSHPVSAMGCRIHRTGPARRCGGFADPSQEPARYRPPCASRTVRSGADAGHRAGCTARRQWWHFAFADRRRRPAGRRLPRFVLSGNSV